MKQQGRQESKRGQKKVTRQNNEQNSNSKFFPINDYFKCE